MHLSDIAIIFATILGPILAVQAQRIVDLHRERRKAKDNIFRTLMATRGTRLSPEHVRALNMVELEFEDKRSKPVREAWRAYNNHLNTRMADDALWSNKMVDLLVDMLYEMKKYLKYPDFDKTQIRTSWYAPVAHNTLEEENTAIRGSLIKVLKGESALVIAPEEPNVRRAGVSQGQSPGASPQMHTPGSPPKPTS